jgi:alkylation response protein AidB-like acyl-CoA dehydrogenase
MLELTPEERAFHAEVLETLAPFEALSSFLVSPGRERVDPFYRHLAAKNWLALSWPKAAGGLGLSPMHEFLLWNEAAYRNIARPPQGAGVVAKTLMRHGTAEQKALWLERIRRHQTTFALAYSEPEAGSDLGSVRCAARLEAGHYVINGNKCWNSKAAEVDNLWLLARTGDAASGSRGLSLLIVDVKTPGVRIRPIALMDGNQVSEIFFDDARVPESCRVGPENAAWRLMADALADERHIHFLPGRVRHDYWRLKAWLEDRGRLDDPCNRRRFEALSIDVAEAEALGLMILSSTDKRGGEVAANKLAHVRAIQEIARTAMEIGGPEAYLAGAVPALHWSQTMTESVGGGTTEIMESLVARRRLGLPVAR